MTLEEKKNKLRKYAIAIDRLARKCREADRWDSMAEGTGGIVQGMSGSPILQDGRLIGAVTHVLLADPAKGYGVSIDDMLAAAQAA